jgi:hypothetical protein
MYTWLTTFDSFSSYACLPVSIPTLLTSKMCSFAVLQLIPAALIVFVSIASGGTVFMVPALVLCLAVSFYALAVTIWLTGLSPSVLVYDAKVLLLYLVTVGVAIFILIALAFINPYYVLASVLLVVPGWVLVKQSYRKWESWDQPGF